MILYTWSVIQDCRPVGYVRAYSEFDAIKKAKEKFGDRLFVERVYVGDLAEEKE